jgi:hypothetical protein
LGFKGRDRGEKKTDKPIKLRKPEKNNRKNQTEKKTELTD